MMLRQIGSALILAAGIALGATISAPQTIPADVTLYAIADSPNGTPYLVPLDAVETPTAWPTPTPIVPRTLTIVPTETRTATPTQVTPAAPTHTPQGYPYFADINGGDGARYRVLGTTLRIRNEPALGALIVGQYTQGQMPLMRCLYNVSASEAWASEQTCISPAKYWSAVYINGVTYLELVQD